MAVLVYLVLFSALIAHSSATYCVCKDGVGDSQLQKALDYACGAGADCTPILQNGACFQPNTVKDHCSYAVNSYFQRKGQAVGSCDFSQTATTSTSPPAGTPSTCVYPASSSTAGTGTTTPTTGTGTTTPTTGTGTTTPTTGTGGTTNPTTGTGTGIGTGTGTGTGTTVTPTPFGTGLGPTGSGFDNSGSGCIEGVLTLWFSGLVFLLWA
ncbi:PLASMODESMATA CALLOSE-BINDING PROTEIN 3 [Euphorbia lathyris]|uniref:PLASMODESMATA CALLOSE-BINDING PROTEIN 3 n=1 Tax=Euphorbia lathyris TaxID=212925 RepID=UPI003313CC25